MRWVDPEQTMIDCGGGRYVPADPGNSDYAAIIASGAAIETCATAAPTGADLDAEYTRRLVAQLGARDLAHASFIRADDRVELTALLAIATPTAEQTARVGELQARDAAIVALIDAYNAIPDAPVPADYAAASRWP